MSSLSGLYLEGATNHALDCFHAGINYWTCRRESSIYSCSRIRAATTKSSDPRLQPAPIPSPLALRPGVAENILLPSLPLFAIQSDIQDSSKLQESPGRGIGQQPSAIGDGVLLYDVNGTCSDFNLQALWASTGGTKDIWSDHYVGWIPFAMNSGFYRAANVVFSFERVVGPGSHYGDQQLSAKISSSQPYAAGIGSPLIKVPPGADVLVQADYLIWDHDTHGLGLGIIRNKGRCPKFWCFLR